MINRHYLDERWPEAFRANNADAIRDLAPMLRGPLKDEVGPDLMNLIAHDAQFRETLREGVFYKRHSDEPFQLLKRSVVFGYLPPTSKAGHAAFVTIRFPKELADALEFRPVGE